MTSPLKSQYNIQYNTPSRTTKIEEFSNDDSDIDKILIATPTAFKNKSRRSLELCKAKYEYIFYFYSFILKIN